MEGKVFNLLKNSYAVTSNNLKRRLLYVNGRPSINSNNIFENSLIAAVGLAEGKNPPVIKDINPEGIFVVETSRRKAAGMIPLVVEHFTRTSDPRVFYAMDSVYSFKHTSKQGISYCYVVNKPDSPEKILEFYRKRAGDAFYSTSSIHFVQPNLNKPIPFAIFTKIRVGTWTGEVPAGFKPSSNDALGMTLREAVDNGFVKVDYNNLKIEFITYDYDPSFKDTGGDNNIGLVQKNYELHLTYDEIKDHLQSIAIGIIPDEILKRFGEPIRIQRFMKH